MESTPDGIRIEQAEPYDFPPNAGHDGANWENGAIPFHCGASGKDVVGKLVHIESVNDPDLDPPATEHVLYVSCPGCGKVHRWIVTNDPTFEVEM